jgi:23S rRNA (adenine2503-C2)-methyltransferase
MKHITEETIFVERPTIKGMLPAELELVCQQFGQPKYRALQLFDWIYNKKVRSFSAMNNLPADVREQLTQAYLFEVLTLHTTTQSTDGTKKFLFTTVDGKSIETVLIPSEMLEDDGSPRRLTVCISTQVGCPLHCQFCATASIKLKRNLTTAEIIEQFLIAQQHSEHPITNLVFMGMGEPMLNYENVMKSVDILTHPKAELLTSKRITLSTAGIIEGIHRMADEGRSIKLALSLHATTDGMRSSLMPINKKHNLRALGDALEYYYRKTHIPVTFEYILFDQFNDSDEDIKRLAKFTRRVPSKVNVIPFHPIDFTNPEGLAAELRPTTFEKFQLFIAALRRHDVTVMIRTSSGKDIAAACGQLALHTHQDAIVHE